MALSKPIKKWVAALRSGEYDQAFGALHYAGDGYCCLGVACDVAKKEGLPIETTNPEDGDLVEFNNETAVLPLEVREWLGVVSPDGYLSRLVEPSQWFGDNSLMALNDRHFSFDQIADIIEWYYDDGT